MELNNEYINGDILVNGNLGLNHIDKVDASLFIDLDGERSFDQKRFYFNNNLSVLVFEAGDIDLYGEEKTIYMDAPILGDLSYSFDTGLNLFPKMPTLTADPNPEWFMKHLQDIIDLIESITLVKTGKSYTDESGKTGEGFTATIHQGTGHFIWELLSKEDPDHDISFTYYITPENHINKIEMDLSNSLDGAYFVLEGSKMGNLLFTYKLPEDEYLEISAQKSDKYINYANYNILFHTNNEKDIIIQDAFKWQRAENGIDIELKNLSVYEKNSKETKLLAQGYYLGGISKTNLKEDVFKGKADYLYSFEALDWKEIRKDTSGFINDVLSKLKP